jgi:hypothetical protein
VSLNTAQQYIQSLLDDLPLPGTGTPNLNAVITPPDPNVQAEIPTAYIWPTKGTESRNPGLGGTIPRNTGPGTPSGLKPLEHELDIFVVYFGQDDDTESDTLFPGIVEAIMQALRTSPDPMQQQDPYTGVVSTFVDVGEHMSWEVTINAVEDQAYNRYDALLICRLFELIFA